MIAVANLFSDIPETLADEQITAVFSTARVKIERIVSLGQASPPGFWYDQDQSEWVALLAGSAGLLFEGETTARRLKPGDYLHIPAHRRHRIEWTDASRATVWLAVHCR